MSAHANSCEVAIMSSLLGMAWADLTRGLGLFIVWTVLDCTHGMAWHVYKQTWSWSVHQHAEQANGTNWTGTENENEEPRLFPLFPRSLGHSALLRSDPIFFFICSRARKQTTRHEHDLSMDMKNGVVAWGRIAFVRLIGI